MSLSYDSRYSQSAVAADAIMRKSLLCTARLRSVSNLFTASLSKKDASIDLTSNPSARCAQFANDSSRPLASKSSCKTTGLITYWTRSSVEGAKSESGVPSRKYLSRTLVSRKKRLGHRLLPKAKRRAITSRRRSTLRWQTSRSAASRASLCYRKHLLRYL